MPLGEKFKDEERLVDPRTTLITEGCKYSPHPVRIEEKVKGTRHGKVGKDRCRLQD